MISPQSTCKAYTNPSTRTIDLEIVNKLALPKPRREFLKCTVVSATVGHICQ